MKSGTALVFLGLMLLAPVAISQSVSNGMAAGSTDLQSDAQARCHRIGQRRLSMSELHTAV